MTENGKKDDDVKAMAEAKKNVTDKTAETKPADVEKTTTDDTGTTTAKNKKNNMILRTLLLAILVIAAAFAIKHHMLISEYNKALDTKDSGDIKAATTQFEALSAKAYGKIKKLSNQELLKCYIEIGAQDKVNKKLEQMVHDPSISKTDLAKCYVVLGEEPANNIKETKKYYQKALAIDKDILTPIQRKVVDPTYVLPKPPPPTPEEIAAAKQQEAAMNATDKKLSNSAKKIKKAVLKAIPSTK